MAHDAGIVLIKALLGGTSLLCSPSSVTFCDQSGNLTPRRITRFGERRALRTRSRRSG